MMFERRLDGLVAPRFFSGGRSPANRPQRAPA